LKQIISAERNMLLANIVVEWVEERSSLAVTDILST